MLDKINDQGLLNRAHEEAVSALIALGYKPQEASRAISKVEGHEGSSQELIRKALQGLARVS